MDTGSERKRPLERVWKHQIQIQAVEYKKGYFQYTIGQSSGKGGY